MQPIEPIYNQQADTKGIIEYLNALAQAIKSNFDEAQISYTPFFTIVPDSVSSVGSTGSIAFDSNYLYVCIADNTWRRVGLNIW